ncbi:MAG: glycine betaine ABC transporter substrate-binding protein [Longimicrobiales bacterium]
MALLVGMVLAVSSWLPGARGGLTARPQDPIAGTAARQDEAARPVVVASKPFGESFLLAEMFAQLLEARGFVVDRRLGLGATEIAFEALRNGAIDVYPEYTGTGLVAILGESPRTDPREVFSLVARTFRDRWGIRWLPPLGFQNTYAIAVRRETADSLGLRSLSDLARIADRLVAGFTPDFIGRDDGLPGLRQAYDLRFRDVRSLLQAVKYQALAEQSVDVIDGYSTDGFITRYDLVVLEDDRGFFPAYEAAPLTSRALADRPAAIAALTELAGRLDEPFMRRLNQRIEVGGEAVADVAALALDSLGLNDPAGTARPTRGRDPASLLPYLWDRRAETLRLTLRHLLLVAVALAVAIAAGVPFGLALERLGRGAETAIRSVGLLQVVPSIALLAFMIPLFGIGITPALIALFLYALYPIIRNTYSGVSNASQDAVLAAEALGMTPGQVLRQVRLPLAAPVIMAGIRTAAVISVGTATLAAFIGAGGLGDPIVAGLALSDTRMILSGAIPAALLALIVDAALARIEKLTQPKP